MSIRFGPNGEIVMRDANGVQIPETKEGGQHETTRGKYRDRGDVGDGTRRGPGHSNERVGHARTRATGRVQVQLDDTATGAATSRGRDV